MTNKTIAVYNPTSGLIERLKTGDTPVDGSGNPIGGGATAAGSIGEIQYKGISGNLAASTNLTYTETLSASTISLGATLQGSPLNISADTDLGGVYIEDVAGNGINISADAFTSSIGAYANQIALSVGSKSIVLDNGAVSFTMGSTSMVGYNDTKGLVFTSAGKLSFSAGGVTGDGITFTSSSGNGTNQPGGGITLNSGNSTGNKTSSIIFLAAMGGTSGSTTRTAVEVGRFLGSNFGINVATPLEALHVVGNEKLTGFVNQNDKSVTYSGSKTLTNDTATGLFEVAIPTNVTGIGGFCSYTVMVVNGTDVQMHSGFLNFVGARKANTVTSGIAESASEATVMTNGSLTENAWTITNGTGKITVNANFNSDVATPVLTINYILTIHGTNAVTLL
jgi:hypothetical protein